jgi:hypothetical protein
MGEMRNAYRILIGEPKEKRPLGRILILRIVDKRYLYFVTSSILKECWFTLSPRRNAFTNTGIFNEKLMDFVEFQLPAV